MNKFNFIANNNNKNAIVTEKLINTVRASIDLYLRYVNCDFIKGLDAFIFGGAVRDSIASLDIHDVDVLVLPFARISIIELLTKKFGFSIINKFNSDIANLYLNVSLIQEPTTLQRENVFIQLIRPAGRLITTREQLHKIASEIDLSCCGVSFYPNVIYENHPNAINDCIEKKFKVLQDKAFHCKDRILHRIEKLTSRGWTEIK